MTIKQELNTVKDLIIHILKHKPNTRNSDTLLYLETCKYLGAETIDDMMALDLNIITVHKIRQVIQNKEGLYLPDKEITRERKRRKVEIKDYMARIGKEQ